MVSAHSLSTTVRRPSLARLRPHPELLFFVGAYLLYIGARWVFAGDPRTAIEHAQWIVGLERSTHVAIEASVQGALSAPAVSWLLSNVYLAAQLVVLPGALVLLYRRARPIYRRLRTTVIATWMIAVPIHGLWPVAPPRLSGLGIRDTVSARRMRVGDNSFPSWAAFKLAAATLTAALSLSRCALTLALMARD